MVTTAYPTNKKLLVLINGSWVDLAADVVTAISGDYGISGYGISNRVAGTGQLTFSLRNDSGNLYGAAGAYSPSHASCITGWKKGIPVRLLVQYDTVGQNRDEDYFQVWGGFIQDIDPDAGSTGQRRCKVKCADWMNIAGTHPILTPSILYNKKMNEVVGAIVSTMPIQPDVTDYYSGTFTYPTCFDLVQSNTKALSEFQKVNNSELGWIYLRPPTKYELGFYPNATECLVVQGRTTRQQNEVSYIPKLLNESSHLTTEDSFCFRSESTQPDFYLFCDEVTQVSFDNNMQSLDVEYGKNVINSVTTKVYPRTSDTVDVVLATLNSPTQITAGSYVQLSLSYKDPNNQAQSVAGDFMITPVATTDYAMYSTSGSTGTDLTANLTVAATYYANKADYTLTNTGGVTGYVTKLQARGRGIYTYNPIEYTTTDSTSVNDYGYSSVNIDMKYQDSVTNGQRDAGTILNYNKNPRNIPKKISLNANYDSSFLNAFLNYTVGKKIYIKENQTGVANWYYIQKVVFNILLGGVINFSYELSPVDTYS